MPHLGDAEAAVSAYAGVIGLGVMAAHAVVAAILIAGARALARSRGGAWRMAVWAPIVAVVLPICGVATTVFALIRAFRSVASVAPAERSATLAQGISEAMNATACAFVLSWALYVACAVAITIGHVTRPRATR